MSAEHPWVPPYTPEFTNAIRTDIPYVPIPDLPPASDEVETWMRRKGAENALTRVTDKLANAERRNQRGATVTLADLRAIVALAVIA